jgi:hypothetical protein
VCVCSIRMESGRYLVGTGFVLLTHRTGVFYCNPFRGSPVLVLSTFLVLSFGYMVLMVSYLWRTLSGTGLFYPLTRQVGSTED